MFIQPSKNHCPQLTTGFLFFSHVPKAMPAPLIPITPPAYQKPSLSLQA